MDIYLLAVAWLRTPDGPKGMFNEAHAATPILARLILAIALLGALLLALTAFGSQ